MIIEYLLSALIGVFIAVFFAAAIVIIAMLRGDI
jgi:hypothetical protein